MAHIALYRTYRTHTFSEMVGQKHIKQTLQNSLRENRLSHAYLFSGPRGTGKTSAARLLAKAVNCERGPAEEPCNECSACRRITDGTMMDVVEIDAASNRGVDEIRDLRDKVKYAPTEVRMKVYIIDEVHMLTTEAFNALLKTLEEPPAHVMFILATTEPHRIPATIHSRCQRFDFKRVALAEQVMRLQYVCGQEQIVVDNEALHYIARLSDGGMRDALSILDQAASFSTGSITIDDVLAMTGGLPMEGYEALLDAVRRQDVGDALQLVDRYMQEGKSADKFAEGCIHFIRDLLLLRLLPADSSLAERIFDADRLRGSMEHFTSADMMRMIEVLNHYYGEMKYAVQPQTLLEIAVMRLCTADGAVGGPAEAAAALARATSPRAEGPSPHGGSAALASPPGGDALALALRVQRLEEQLVQLLQGGGAAGHGPGAGSPAAAASSRGAGRAPAAGGAQSTRSKAQLDRFASGGDSDELRAVAAKWSQVLAAVKDRKITVHAWLVDGEPVAVEGGTLLLVFRSAMHRETTDKPDNKGLIEQVVQEVAGKPLKLVTAMVKDWRDAQTSSDPQPPEEMKMEAQGETAALETHVDEALKLFGEQLVVIKEEDD